MKHKSKLYRNLKPGDNILLIDCSSARMRHCVLTVSSVVKTINLFSHKSEWIVNGNYPWWWTIPIHAYGNERVQLCV